ncbi:CCA tRNA nucleotidyltransferase [Ensifer soli]|uniref:CCA tRNA nucleotidyltransferase n=1 Tax=Ciceribacter sp. sgz301302 TaxID=3342379 RepID=UPI0035B84D92
MTSIAGADWFSDPALRRVLDLLNGEGAETRIAGGAVRNSLMGVPAGDIDLATTLTPDAIVSRAQSAGIRSVPTGIAHGTVTLVVDGVPFEVTTLRRDVATDGRHAEVAFTDDWKADAERRDLTINALYADRSGTVVDLVGGLADIETRTVRFIGRAEDRVAEDHLRILRFFRFFAFYGAGRPDAEGLRACARARGSLAKLSAERVWSETKKLLSAPDPGRALLWMRQAGILTEILPETEKWGIDAIPALIKAEAAFGWEAEPLVRLAAMVPPDPERLAALGARLRLSRAEQAFLAGWAEAPALTETMADTTLERLLYRHGRHGIATRIRLSLALARAASGDDPSRMAAVAAWSRRLAHALEWKKPVFPVSGADLLAAGMVAGPDLGETLSRLEERWVAGNFRAGKADLLKDLPIVR